MDKPQAIVQDEKLKPVFDHIFRNAMGNPVIFTEQPTSAGMKASTWGFYGNELYVKFANNITIKFSGTVVA
jgi:hypothetical protein